MKVASPHTGYNNKTPAVHAPTDEKEALHMLRLAIIGAGLMGEDHARIVTEALPGATLQVICDKDLGRAKAVAQAFGAQDASDDPEGCITRSDVDAVIIASPDFTHTPLSKACIAAGKPVLCEKPLS